MDNDGRTNETGIPLRDMDQSFDFEVHAGEAVSVYLPLLTFYKELAAVVKRILNESIKRQGIKVHSVEARAKDPESLRKKAALPSLSDPAKPKYSDPLSQITDLAGIRVITFFPGTLAEIDGLISDEFEVVERSDKEAKLLEEDRFGYQSIHYLVTLSDERTALAEYARYANRIAEIQVRTILQHAWAEIEHDIQYKTVSVIPAGIRRRFMSLVGLLEIADREFQAIQDADRRLTEEARKRVNEGRLEEVEITPDALKTFLDKEFGSDGRISAFTYEWSAGLLRKLGYQTMGQVQECIRSYDDDALSRELTGGRQGQTTRFEYMLLAGMGETYVQRHFWSKEPWFTKRCARTLERMSRAGIEVRAFDPLSETPKEEEDNLGALEAE